MKVIIDPQAGFCPGVRRAVAQVETRLQRGESLTALGALIHNQREIDRLAGLGLETVSQEVADRPEELAALKGRELFIRTHGVGSALQNQLHESGFDIIDGTCPTVKRVQKLAAEHHRRGEQIVIIGKKGHAEVIGILGHCDNMGIVVADEEDLMIIDPERKTFVIAQTTIGGEQFRRLCRLIAGRAPGATFMDTTCPFITRRYDQIAGFAASVSLLIFVGGRESSNSKVLFEICRQRNPRSHRIESPAELDYTWIRPEDTIGITGGASTPQWQFEEIRDLLGQAATQLESK
ncbi:MAG TPA: 4-hydroxy-3-methylbut-2-enyl diphosphate reductase [bacterium]|nr:4-hydroxy-3-methylbut-2-enyl diphosphate reductase [bacterium]HOC24262.1 4-hydroxy-3-methylbut-2-enyl diphosphate reductase [bacterium]HOY45470.1 4-hydroxy-3-methylbut-2-enyl diphosphate reductase [bacterium]HPG83097.1 4-hydroxy-3-methylbut-2-enyl diphosphate reductase [bacterium]